MQFQSDLLQVPVIRPVVYETTALGAAYLAGLGVGYWESITDIQQQWKADKYFYPAHDAEYMKPYIKGWNRAVKASIAWADSSD